MGKQRDILFNHVITCNAICRSLNYTNLAKITKQTNKNMHGKEGGSHFSMGVGGSEY